MKAKLVVASLLVGLALIAAPSAASAQIGGTSALAGVARDNTGAVLPGVTVEAASPALSEKIRVATTDSEGLYRIVNLNPGTYTVTFTLPGFSTLRREGLELPANFTASVNGELNVGSIEETITVSGQAPNVDVQATVAQTQFSSDLILAIPSPRTIAGYAPMVPGVVGGLNVSATESKSYSIHGSRPGDTNEYIDGFQNNNARGAGGGLITMYSNPALIEEVTVDVGGTSAEQMVAGIATNAVLKDGGNRFSGVLFGMISGEKFETNNLSDELRAQGLTSTSGLPEQWDFSPTLGGPIVKDKLFFYIGYRNSVEERSIAGLYENLAPTGWRYTPDLNNPAVIRVADLSYSTRFTWQATPKDKITVNYELQPHLVYQRGYGALRSPEATSWAPFVPNLFGQVIWQSPVTSRLLLRAGYAIVASVLDNRFGKTLEYGVPSAVDQSDSIIFRSAPVTADHYGKLISHANNVKASASYVTGSHFFKGGMDFRHGKSNVTNSKSGHYSVRLNNGVPNQITQFIRPTEAETWVRQLSFYAQEKWTIKRLTVNAGLRADFLNITAAGGIEQPATPYTPARTFAELDNIPKWNDYSPRLSAAYDLFGDGKTALKVSHNRYVAGYTFGTFNQNNPVLSSVTTTDRSWIDTTFPVGDPRRGNFQVDCNLLNPAAHDECGSISDLNFGNANPRATVWNPEILVGTQVGEFSWESSAGVERELFSGTSVSVMYFRRAYGNLRSSDNTLIGPGDFDPFCVTAPVDSRLPGGGGNQLCGFYDLQSAKRGQVQNYVTNSSDFGEQTEIFNGVDINGKARIRGFQFSGGVSYGRTATSACYVIDSPQVLRDCEITPPFQPNGKFIIVAPLPRGFQASTVIWSVPGPELFANWAAPNANVQPTLGRPLSGGNNVTVPLIKPGTVYGSQVNQVDLRIGHRARIMGRELQSNIDLYNVLNSADIQTVSATFSPTGVWPRPLQTLKGRTIKLSAQLNW